MKNSYKKTIGLLSLALISILSVSGKTNLKQDSISIKNNFISIYEKCSITNQFQKISFDELTFMNRSSNKNLKNGETNNKTQKLDSILIERWNDDSGKLENSQLEYFTWYENNMDKSWELYDWDATSMKWIPNDKETYEWDELGNKTLQVDYDLDTTDNDWLINAQVISTYDDNGNIERSNLQFRNRTTNLWEDSESKIYMLDDNANIIVELTQVWDANTEKWLNQEKMVNTIDDQNRLTRQELFAWNSQESLWESTLFMRIEFDQYGYKSLSEIVWDGMFPPYLIEYVRDANGNPLQVISYFKENPDSVYKKNQMNEQTFNEADNLLTWTLSLWNDSLNDWKTSWARDYEYDSQNGLIYNSQQNLDPIKDSLVPSWKNIHENNKDGQEILKTAFVWQTQSDSWINSYQEHHNYNAQGKESYYDRYDWDSTSNAWEGDLKNNYIFDEVGNYLQESKQKYDKESQEWIDNSAEEYNYNLSVNYSEICYPATRSYGHLSNLFRFDQYQNEMLSKNCSEIKNDQLQTSEKFTFHYSALATSGIQEQPESNFRVYPNPAIDYIVFELPNSMLSASVKIYDTQGRLVISQNQIQNNRISLGKLTSGIYFYKLIQGDSVKQGKILIKQ